MPSDAGVAPEKAEDTQGIFDVSAAEIAQAAGVTDTFIDSDRTENDEESEAHNEEELEEEVEEEAEEDAAEIEDEQEDDEVEEEEEKPKGDSPGIKKRIGKLVERAERAESERDRLQGELTAKQEAPEALSIDPDAARFETVTDPKELDRMESTAEHLREWLITNPEGGEYKDGNGETWDIDYEMAKSLQVRTDKDLRKGIPQQRTNIQLRSTTLQQANNTFHWWSDNGTQEYVEMAGILANNPRAKKFYDSDPHAALLFGYAIEGYKSVHASNGKQEKGKAVEQAPSAPTAPPRQKRAAKKTSSTVKQSRLRKQAMQSGDTHDVRSYLESIL